MGARAAGVTEPDQSVRLRHLSGPHGVARQAQAARVVAVWQHVGRPLLNAQMGGQFRGRAQTGIDRVRRFIDAGVQAFHPRIVEAIETNGIDDVRAGQPGIDHQIIEIEQYRGMAAPSGIEGRAQPVFQRRPPDDDGVGRGDQVQVRRNRLDVEAMCGEPQPRRRLGCSDDAVQVAGGVLLPRNEDDQAGSALRRRGGTGVTPVFPIKHALMGGLDDQHPNRAGVLPGEAGGAVGPAPAAVAVCFRGVKTVMRRVVQVQLLPERIALEPGRHQGHPQAAVVARVDLDLIGHEGAGLQFDLRRAGGNFELIAAADGLARGNRPPSGDDTQSRVAGQGIAGVERPRQNRRPYRFEGLIIKRRAHPMHRRRGAPSVLHAAGGIGEQSAVAGVAIGPDRGALGQDHRIACQFDFEICNRLGGIQPHDGRAVDQPSGGDIEAVDNHKVSRPNHQVAGRHAVGERAALDAHGRHIVGRSMPPGIDPRLGQPDHLQHAAIGGYRQLTVNQGLNRHVPGGCENSGTG